MKKMFLILVIVFLSATVYYDRKCAELEFKHSYFTMEGVYCHKETFAISLNKPLREITPHEYHVPTPETVIF